MEVSVNSFDIPGYNAQNAAAANKPPKIGFVLRKASSESEAQQDMEKMAEKKVCIFDNLQNEDLFLDISDFQKWSHSYLSHTVTASESGLYSLIFARCEPSTKYRVNFLMDAVFSNPGPNYLSAGDASLPDMYLAFFFLFSLSCVVWCYVLVTAPYRSAIVHNIHYMMALLCALKSITVLLESGHYHYMSKTGSVEGFLNVIYYIFAGLKGVMLFTVILLIGSGWSVIKSFLNDREKRIIMVVLTLQVVDNILMVVLEESAPGSKGWLTWRDLLHLVDVICCCTILFPIVWSINHLRQAAGSDGKASANLSKLRLFREFYVMVIAYIYFTRIVVYLLSASIPFHLLWVGDLFTELATLSFFLLTGYKFRPVSSESQSNYSTQVQYAQVPASSEDAECGGYGLRDADDDDDDGVEISRLSIIEPSHSNSNR